MGAQPHGSLLLGMHGSSEFTVLKPDSLGDSCASSVPLIGRSGALGISLLPAPSAPACPSLAKLAAQLVPVRCGEVDGTPGLLLWFCWDHWRPHGRDGAGWLLEAQSLLRTER